jgi:hypothetical protein
MAMGERVMGAGWLACTCLLLAAGGSAGDDVVHINQRNFQIPIKVERASDVSELLLYVSKNQGKNWSIYARVAPDKKAFDYLASEDGLVYFSIAVKLKRGGQDPPDIYKAAVGQKINIDTVRPVVRLVSADRTGDEVQVGWDIVEESPDWTSWKLEYRVSDAPNSSWTSLPIHPTARGSYRFHPYAPGSVTLRLVLRDLAGNEASDERSVVGPAADRSIVTTNAVAPAPSGAPGDGSPPPPPPAPMASTTPARTENTLPPLASSTPPPPAATPATDMGSSVSSANYRGSLPALQIVNRGQVKLGFDVTKFGPSGLGAVDVYVTMNEGSTWEKMPGEPQVSLPLSPDSRGMVRGNVLVPLAREGATYGFYLVVKSKAGLGKPPPSAGMPPHVRVEMDTTPPEAKLFAPQPAADRPESLVLSWDAKDRNLAANPVSLEWAPNPAGPWTFIGDSQLPNTGKYIWAVPGNSPPQVYLRLTVRDIAGNTAVAKTDRAVLIDLSVPEAGNFNVER